MKRKLVYIEWEDHYSPTSPGWQHTGDVEPPIGKCINATVGWIIAEDAKHLRLANQIADIYAEDEDEDESFDGVVTVIKSCITKRKTLKC